MATTWDIRGSYFESCNCDPICPCRTIDGMPGDRSTHGICAGVLSWVIEEGSAGDTDLGGLAVALAIRFESGRRDNAMTVKLTNPLADKFGVSRKSKYAALKALQKAGLVEVVQGPKKTPMVTIVDPDLRASPSNTA